VFCDERPGLYRCVRSESEKRQTQQLMDAIAVGIALPGRDISPRTSRPGRRWRLQDETGYRERDSCLPAGNLGPHSCDGLRRRSTRPHCGRHVCRGRRRGDGSERRGQRTGRTAETLKVEAVDVLLYRVSRACARSSAVIQPVASQASNDGSRGTFRRAAFHNRCLSSHAILNSESESQALAA